MRTIVAPLPRLSSRRSMRRAGYGLFPPVGDDTRHRRADVTLFY
jgi:hypothetical protein